jgi:hypothetical protein
MASQPTEPAQSASLTPRLQLARVVLGAVLAAMLGAGPAIAWDASTQLPKPARAESARSSWKGVGKDVKRAFHGLARTYLPPKEKPQPPPIDPAPPVPAASAAALPTPAPMYPSAIVMMPDVEEDE